MLGYLRLIRLPNVFTAVADILAAYTIMRRGGPVDWGALAALCGSSACLYWSGMAFNDLADREEDALYRPQRPIPSGKVSPTAAMAFAFILVAAGLALAASVGRLALIRAAILTAAVLSYDFAAKGLPLLGPLTLGCCRFMNVLLGASASGIGLIVVDFNRTRIEQPPLVMALTIGFYAAGLTAFSAQEEEGRQAGAISTGWLFCATAMIFALLSSPSMAIWLALMPLAGLLYYLSQLLARTGSPSAARNLVRFGVMGVCVMDAGLILGFAVRDWPWALACVALLAPGFLMAKWLAQKEA